MTPYPSDILGPLIVVWTVMLLIWAGVYVWYALMLSRLFPRLGTEAWKGWVPILNEAKILRLGGVPAWSVVFYFLPIVNLYGLYLKFVATSRINAHFGKGVGTTVLAVLLPPVWATLLVVGSRPVDPALQERIAPSIPERSGYALAVSPPPAADPQPPVPGVPSVPGLSPAPGVPPMAPPPPVAPPPPAAFPAGPAPTAGPAAPPPPPPPSAPPASATAPAPPAPPAFPPPSAAPGGVLPPPPLVAPPAPPAPPAPLPAAAPAAPAVSAEPAPASPPPAPPSPPPAVASEPPAPAAEPAHIVPPPGLLIPPPPVLPAAAPAAPPAPPAAAAPAPAAVPAQPWSPLAPPAAPLAPPAAPVTPPAAAPTPEPADEDEEAGDELDRTVVVDRRPRIPWVLRVEEGPEFRLTGSSVVLGRRPTAAAGTQDIAVPDPTRTLSKVHARLDLADGVWTVTDLNATNGVIVVAADGTEELLDPGASAVVAERFVLGKVGMRIALDDAADG